MDVAVPARPEQGQPAPGQPTQDQPVPAARQEPEARTTLAPPSPEIPLSADSLDDSDAGLDSVPIGQRATAGSFLLRNTMPRIVAPRVFHSAPRAAVHKTTTANSRRAAHRVLDARSWQPAQLIVPVIDLDVAVVQGVDNGALRLGPGHDPDSGLPGERGNCVIAGHRNVHGSYFWYLPRVTPGSLVLLRTARETFVYKVVSARVVPGSQTSVLERPRDSGAAPTLTLYTCTLPKTTNRFIVVAHLIRTEPLMRTAKSKMKVSKTSRSNGGEAGLPPLDAG